MSDRVPAPPEGGEQMDIVIVGHVDHGKSTLVGRLLADTGSLPEGRLEEVRARCAKNARPFEYAFLLDALKNEQAQGITIDAARCFFKTAKRRYILHDAPGHIEFLKNMVTGAARAEAALLLIDAHEGIRENSRRHGYILSLLGIRQIAVLVNKMDLVGRDRAVFDRIEAEYRAFLAPLGVQPVRFIPVAALAGENIATRAETMPWYDGPTVLGQIDAFVKPGRGEERPFRMPVQDIYKFTEAADERRIVTGTVLSGALAAGDEVVFHPSGKRARVASIEAFHVSPAPTRIAAAEAAGFTLATQIYIRPGELAARAGEPPPKTATRLRANLFWMGRSPFRPGQRVKLKLGAARVPAELAAIRQVVDASEMARLHGKTQIDRHDVAEVTLECAKPVAFDLASDLEKTARFVLVDGHDIAGCGVILGADEGGASALAEEVRRREAAWDRGVDPADRAERYRHGGKCIVIAGPGAAPVARALEQALFAADRHVYYLGAASLFRELRGGADVMAREEQVRQLGEMSRALTGAGLLFVTALEEADGAELRELAVLNEPNPLFVVAFAGAEPEGASPDLILPASIEPGDAAGRIVAALEKKGVVQGDYQI